MAKKSLLVCADRSGAGKTTTTLGLVAALKKSGFKVAAAKTGPDFIDSSYLQFISGLPCARLDLWLDGSAGVKSLFEQRINNLDQDICIVEGVMGLFDGGLSSSANLALNLNFSVLLLLDVHGLAESVRALAYGYLKEGLDRGLNYAGVILTHVGSDKHANILTYALNPLLEKFNIPLIGLLKSCDAPKLASRHLGLKQISENFKQISFDYLASWFINNTNFSSLLKILKLERPQNPILSNNSKKVALTGQAFFASALNPKFLKTKATLAIAYDSAFNFCYADLPAFLKELGINIVFFSPLKDSKLPNCQGIYFPGGYPELFVQDLANNLSLKAELHNAKDLGKLIYGECGGFIYLFESLTLLNAEIYPMCGLLKGSVSMQATKKALGYREATLCADFISSTSKVIVRGHEFHYSSVSTSLKSQPLWQLKNLANEDLGYAGIALANIAGSYVHLTTYGAKDFWRGLVRRLNEV